ncbi:BLUF domain-containing protein [Erythrobacter sp. HL-111]|uniref:BLUF domain-containing protein n=1 Tax=Erythrobacter sp. HL-111 TaxID=1798193 RepID=UPI0006DA3881|nr:BLUF domain-containing protein [Erythrobacter sp. HL-111]KPP90649.1 MAG: Sensors of blue-light using FAD [Erythrobacteraceae bacterium HL-111]SDS75608.1 Sensors of blue-light using FAD [Erythrobacter sp. HL-111]
MLNQYLYISTAPNLSREEVEAILGASARNNPERGITGLLLYNGRNFLQLLEGEESALVALMVRIGNDPRHTGVSVLGRKAISQRSCPGWAMKRVLIAESVAGRREVLERELPAGLDEETRGIILNFACLN